MTTPQGPRPRAFRLPGAEPAPEPRPEAGAEAPSRPQPEAPPKPRPDIRFVDEPFEIVEAADRVPVPVAPRRGPPWLSIFLSALGSLVAIGVGLSLERLVSDLFATAPWLGWVALALVVVAGVALLAIVGREALGVWRERKIEHVRERALAALTARDHTAAQGVVQELRGLYADRRPWRTASSASTRWAMRSSTWTTGSGLPRASCSRPSTVRPRPPSRRPRARCPR